MSVTVRPYVNGGWEVDIRVQLPDGSVIRERKKASATEQAGGAEMGRVSRARAARPRQAEAGEGGGDPDTYRH